MTKPNTIQTLKGFRDFLPKEALKRQWLVDKIRKVFETYGYDPLETPTLEKLKVFEGQIGEEEKLFYKFKDQGGREVALRYDQTVPTCRVVGLYRQQLPIPFRRYQIQLAYRAEKPQKGRYREFLQCDADIFGIKSPLADAEVITLSLDIYRRLGFKKAKLLVNDRQLLKEIPYQAITAIDKLKKIGEKKVLQEMKKKGISKEKSAKYLSKIKSLKPNETINTIFSYLEKTGFDKDWYEFDPTITRSFSYSTGPVWEIFIPGFTSGSVLGGERYDKLVKMISGVDMPGTGFGLGFDRTLEAAEKENLIPNLITASKVLVTVFNKKLLENSVSIATKLRKAEINTEVYPSDKAKLDKQLRYANKKGIPFVLIIGPDEVSQHSVIIKNLKTGKQSKIKIDSLIPFIKSFL
jgi:histidyl-tRNA synthetase